MIRFPSFPQIDLTSFDLNKIRSIELPKFDLPKFDLPAFDLPTFDLAKVDDRIVDVAKNAAYLTVGLAAAAVQRIAKLAA